MVSVGALFHLSAKSKTALRLVKGGHLVVDIDSTHQWAVLHCPVPKGHLLAALRAINRRKAPAAAAGIRSLTLIVTQDASGDFRFRLTYLAGEDTGQTRRCSLPMPRDGRATGVRPIGPTALDWGLSVEGLVYEAMVIDGSNEARRRDYSSYLAGLAARRAASAASERQPGS